MTWKKRKKCQITEQLGEKDVPRMSNASTLSDSKALKQASL